MLQGVMNEGAPAQARPNWGGGDPIACRDHVRAYLVSLGTPDCQIAQTTLYMTGTEWSFGFGRGVDGIPIVESEARARLNDRDESTAEILFWPTIPVATIDSARAFRDELSEPARLAAYEARLPMDARGDGRVAIHHARLGPTPRFAVTWDTGALGGRRSFDQDGLPLTVDGW
jgi:hypothetical protein